MLGAIPYYVCDVVYMDRVRGFWYQHEGPDRGQCTSVTVFLHTIPWSFYIPYHGQPCSTCLPNTRIEFNCVCAAGCPTACMDIECDHMMRALTSGEVSCHILIHAFMHPAIVMDFLSPVLAAEREA